MSAKERPSMAKIPPWPDLPVELLFTIANLLTSNPLYVLSFRSVCKSWKIAFPAPLSPNLSPNLPLFTPAPPFELCGRSEFKSCVLTPTVVYSFRPPSKHPLGPFFGSSIWVCFVDQWTKRKVSFRHPFEKRCYSLPFYFHRTLNLLDFDAFELGRFYNLTYLTCDNPSLDNLVKPLLLSEGPVKVVLLLDMSGIVVLYSDGKLGLIMLGQLGSNWEILHDGQGFRFDDIVEFEGRVLGVDRRGRVYEIGLDKPYNFNLIVPPIAGGGGRRKRLVESLGKLYLAVRCERCTVSDRNDNVAFKVYQLLDVKRRKKMKKKWGKVGEFGDRVFFFGVDFSLSFSAQQLGGVCKKNCIFYTQRSFWNYTGERDDAMIFRGLGPNELHIGVWHLEDAAHVGVIGSYPSYSKLLWPPPSWIRQFDRLEPLKIVAAAIDDIIMTVPGGLEDCFQLDGLETEEQGNSQDDIFYDVVSGQRKKKLKRVKSRLDEEERVVELSRVFTKKRSEVLEQNMKIVEKSRNQADEIQKQLNFFHQYHSSCSSPSQSSCS